MSLSVECYEKQGDRTSGVLAQQRRLIWGLIVWSTLLTLILAGLITFQFINRPSEVSAKPQNSTNTSHSPAGLVNIPMSKDPSDNLIIFDPNWDTEKVEQLQWKTNTRGGITVLVSTPTELNVVKDGYYFLYLQVTLDSREAGQNYTVTLSGGSDLLLRGYINGTQLSTGFMGRGFPLTVGSTLHITCKPEARIKTSETYLGMIMVGSH